MGPLAQWDSGHPNHDQPLLTARSGKQLIAVDGKTIRGSGKSNFEQQHCLSAYAAETGLTLGVEFVMRKSNEIPAIPKLLDQLETKVRCTMRSWINSILPLLKASKKKASPGKLMNMLKKQMDASRHAESR